MSKTIAQEQFEIKHANEVEVAKRELARMALDTIRVFNPLETTFAFMHDRYWHKIPAKSYKDLDRYLARHFFKKICDKMIGDQIMLKGEELKSLREKQFGTSYLDKYEENVEIWDRTPRLNDPDLIEKIRQVVIVGLVAEYGMDEPEADLQVEEAALDYRSLHERVFDGMNTRVSQEMPQEAPHVAAQVEVVRKPIEELLNTKTMPAQTTEVYQPQPMQQPTNRQPEVIEDKVLTAADMPDGDLDVLMGKKEPVHAPIQDAGQGPSKKAKLEQEITND